jgi:hypothetical protein
MELARSTCTCRHDPRGCWCSDATLYRCLHTPPLASFDIGCHARARWIQRTTMYRIDWIQSPMVRSHSHECDVANEVRRRRRMVRSHAHMGHRLSCSACGKVRAQACANACPPAYGPPEHTVAHANIHSNAHLHPTRTPTRTPT